LIIKAIIFDFGEVLNVLDDPAEDEARRIKLAQRLHLEPAEVWSYLFEGQLARMWFSGAIEREDFWTEILASRGISDPEEIEAITSTVFMGRERVNPEMETLAQELSGRCKLAVLSNTGWSEAEMSCLFYNDFGLQDQLFDVIVTSYSAGVTKPDPAIFHLAIDRLGVKPEETIFTDDVAKYTASASQLGIHTHTFTTPALFREYLRKMSVL
jgi:epoxide hydrolase-like predicted phosphatase